MTFSAAPAGGTTATGSATLSVATIPVASGGAGYTSAPLVVISGGGGSGATATAVLGTGGTAGQVVSITITNAGSGYTAIPTVTFTNAGTGETTAATIGTVTGTVTGVTISNAGNGYATAPTYTFGAVSGATAATAGTVTLAGNQLIFTSVPTLTGTTGNAILPYAYVTSAGTTPTTTTDFATYGTGASTTAANNAAPNQLGIARFDNYSTGAINSATTGTVYKMTTVQTLSVSNVSLNGILISGNLGGTALTGSGQTLTLTGGALLTTGGSNTVSVSSLNLSSAEGIVITDGNANTTTLSSNIVGTAGFSISGTGTLSLPNANTSGSVQSIQITNGGSGYALAPTVTIATGGGVQAIGTATITKVVLSATVATGGTSYTSAPVVTFSGGGGTGAAAIAVLNGGVVTSIVITNPGTGYTAAPTYTFSGGGFATAATAGTVTTTGVVASITITAAGTGYLSAPVITFNNTGTGGSSAAASAVINNGQASYSGTTTVNTSVTLGANNAIPGTAGGITLTSGTITNNMAANTPLIIPNAVTFNPIISNISFAGTGGSVLFNDASNTVAGTVTFAAAGGNTNLTIPSGFTVTVGTPITVGTNVITAAGSITKLGTGTLTIAAANVSATTVTTVEAGILLLQASNGLGATGGKAIIGNGATLQVQQITNATVSVPADPITVIGSGASGTTGAIQMLGGGTGANTILSTLTMLGDTTIGVDVGQLTLSGVISGAAAVNKVGLGLLALSGTNTFNGITTVTNGILAANSTTALGAITAGAVVNTGTTLQVGAAITGKQVTLNGTGFGSQAAGGISGLLLPIGASAIHGRRRRHLDRQHHPRHGNGRHRFGGAGCRHPHRSRHHQRRRGARQQRPEPDQGRSHRRYHRPQRRQHVHGWPYRQRRPDHAGQCQHLRRRNGCRDSGQSDRQQLRHRPEHEQHYGRRRRRAGDRQQHYAHRGCGNVNRAWTSLDQHAHHAQRGHPDIQRQQQS